MTLPTEPPQLVHWPYDGGLTLQVGYVTIIGFKVLDGGPEGKELEEGKAIDDTVHFEWDIEWVSGPVILGWNGAD